MIMIADSSEIETLESCCVHPEIPAASRTTTELRTNRESQKQEGRLIDEVSAALLFGTIGLMMLAFGSVMTGLAFTLEVQYLSLAAIMGCRTDIAGPVLSGVGGAIFCYCCGLLTGRYPSYRPSSNSSKEIQSPTRTKEASDIRNLVRTIEGIQYHCSNDQVRF